jgi:hypothetical protein
MSGDPSMAVTMYEFSDDRGYPADHHPEPGPSPRPQLGRAVTARRTAASARPTYLSRCPPHDGGVPGAAHELWWSWDEPVD